MIPLPNDSYADSDATTVEIVPEPGHEQVAINSIDDFSDERE